MRKRLMSMMLCLALALTMMPATGLAAEKTETEGKEVISDLQVNNDMDLESIRKGAITPVLDPSVPGEGDEIVATVTTPARNARKSITMSTSQKMTVNYGDTIQIYASNVQSYSSSKTSVATVSASGLVTTSKEGTAKIKITFKDKKYIYLTVTAVDPLKATSITLKYGSYDAGTTLYVLPNQSITLNATMAPSTATSTITWKSSSSKYVKVNPVSNTKCTVTGIAKGTAYVSVKTSTKKTDKVKIVVINKLDNIRPKPTTAYIKQNYLHKCGLELKSIEIVSPTKVVCEYYVCNGYSGKVSKLTNMELGVGVRVNSSNQVSASGTTIRTIAYGTFSGSKKVGVGKYSSKVVKFTFDASKVGYTNINLNSLDPTGFYGTNNNGYGISYVDGSLWHTGY